MSRTLPKADLQCAACHSRDLYVTDSRGDGSASAIVRRRKCAQCGANRHSTELPNEPITEDEAQRIIDFAARALAAYHRRLAA